MFEEIKKETFDERETRILDFWKSNRIFEDSVENRKGQPHFAFYDGPPFATGLPHYGHFLAGTVKDVVLRYKTMKGFHVPRRFGWDCHGLPVEYEVEKANDLSGAHAIEEFGIANFNEKCRSIVLRYTKEWEHQVMRMGRWVDFTKTYHTMDLSFMESVWWVFQQLYEKGLVYKGYKVMPYSWKLGTPLSNFEAGENYREVDDPSLTVSFPLIDEPQTSLLIWTTTPWTLISNLAIMAGPEVDYVKIKDKEKGKNYILAKQCLSTYYKSENEYEIVSSLKGKELENTRYEPLFNYFKDRARKVAFRVIMEDSISVEEGTGLVHSAPAFGETDFYACERAGIELVCPVDTNGSFTKEIPEYAGKFVKDADKDIIKRAKDMGRVIHHGVLRHRYPFCWRSDTPLIYKAVSTWFVAVEKIKESMLANNNKIHWMPEHLKQGRFGKWLEGARDWAISRNRYWGTPIPLWIAEDGTTCVVGNIKELEEATGKEIHDIHRHHIDDLVFKKNGKLYKRIPEVFDCWFESGSMPYAQNHYPFENSKLFEENFPADFIAEGLDQTRGWFYTLTVLAAALFNKPAFKNVIVNGIVLAADGTKMSKRLKNYPDPMKVVSDFGADSIRLYMMNSGAVKAEDLRFQERGVELVLRQILIPLWNAYSFLNTYARIYGWKPEKDYPHPTALIDRWILSMCNKLIKDVEEGMDGYNLSLAVEPFVGFIDQLTNWYIRRSRRRFWEDEDSPDRREAFSTLYQVLLALTKIAAPFVPFISDAIYQDLRTEGMPASVHLCDYPTYHAESRDERLEAEMAAVQQTVSLGHALRKEHKLKVRQPLPAVHIASSNPKVLEFLKDQQHLVGEELNVKKVEFSSNEAEFVQLRAKPNFRVLGKKLGKLMKSAHQTINSFNQKQLGKLLEGNNITLTIEDEEVELTPEDVEVDRIVHEGMIASNQGEITIALDTQLNDELIIEGLAREVVNKINSMRREAGFNVSDRIKVTMETTEKVKESYEQHTDYIHNEVLAVAFNFKQCDGTEWDLNGEPAKIALEKVKM
jgi:isoleucyl-tRNA synthetase